MQTTFVLWDKKRMEGKMLIKYIDYRVKLIHFVGSFSVIPYETHEAMVNK